MHQLVENSLAELKSICGRYSVKRLELFGSAASEDRFAPDTSDLDFLVEFECISPGEHAKAYFGLLQGLEDLYHRHIDLVEIRAVSNPYFMESVNRMRRLVYAA